MCLLKPILTQQMFAWSVLSPDSEHTVLQPYRMIEPEQVED